MSLAGSLLQPDTSIKRIDLVLVENLSSAVFEDVFAALIGVSVSALTQDPETSFWITRIPDSATSRYMPLASHGGDGQSRYPATDMPEA